MKLKIKDLETQISEQEKAIQIVKEKSKKLQIQILMIGMRV